MVVVQYDHPDLAESPYVYVDLCPHRLGVFTYDTPTIGVLAAATASETADPSQIIAAAKSSVALPLLCFRSTDMPSDNTAGHLYMLALREPTVFWTDDTTTWPTLIEAMGESPSTIEAAHLAYDVTVPRAEGGAGDFVQSAEMKQRLAEVDAQIGAKRFKPSEDLIAMCLDELRALSLD